MSLFELKKDELLKLDENQLEELIARLCEAELAKRDQPISAVRWMGSIKAADGGIDIEIVTPNKKFEGDFVPKAHTVFQAKRDKMPPSEIRKEMTGKEGTEVLLRRLNSSKGAYIIVSLADNTAPPNYQIRKQQMREEVQILLKNAEVFVDFYDRSRLVQWLNQHIGVQLWVREILGIGLSCWRPHGTWSMVPAGMDDTVIFEDGVSVFVPGESAEASVYSSLPVVRRLIKNTKKSIRIAGLSGVGKTRFVQALFEEVAEGEALDKTQVIYSDIGDGPSPSAPSLLDRLISEHREATLVLDNCPSDLHGSLASRLASTNADIKLITIEYDIRDDNPQTTEVIRVKAHGPDIAERLVSRRFPALTGLNSRRIAEFAEGNCRLALALAEAVPEGTSLASLTDAQLFERLFYQRHSVDLDLKEQAEVLSLVYSFSVANDEEGIDELAVLGELCGKSRQRMHRAAQTLVTRHIAQQRGPWRAVLPHAIANRLAADALNIIPEDELVEVFENGASPRLLRSFCKRLGYLHEHKAAQRIVGSWLGSGGRLSRLLDLDPYASDMLTYAAPVAPELVVDLIKHQLDEIIAAFSKDSYHPARTILLTLLAKIAYDKEHFIDVMQLLLRLAIETKSDEAESKLRSFFCLVHSGTHAPLSIRLQFIESCLQHTDAEVEGIGMSLLSEMLRTSGFSPSSSADFGAIARDYGLTLNFEESVGWLRSVVKLAKSLATNKNPLKRKIAREILASRFQELWRIEVLRPMLLATGRELNSVEPWLDGWRAVRYILHFDSISNAKSGNVEKDRLLLENFEAEIRPHDLAGEIHTLVLGSGNKIWSLDDEFVAGDATEYEKSRKRLSNRAFELGRSCHAEPDLLESIVVQLFETDYAPFRSDFGRGLAAGSPEPRKTWDLLIGKPRERQGTDSNFSVLGGFIEEITSTDRSAATKILDECAEDKAVQHMIVGLHPSAHFVERDFDRCVSVLERTGQPPFGIGELLWRPCYDVVPKQKKVALAHNLLETRNGPSLILDAYNMLLHGEDANKDILGLAHRKVALLAAAKEVASTTSDPSGTKNYQMTQVLRSCLRYGGNELETDELIAQLFERVDCSYGYMSNLEGVVQIIAEYHPFTFLDRALLDTTIEEYKRYGMFRNTVHERSPLDKIDSMTLVDWCRQGNDNRRWKLLARAISPYSTSDPTSSKLTEQAVALLQESPEPLSIVQGFLEELRPSSWSGSRADIIARRAASMISQLDSKSEKIRVAAAHFMAKSKEFEEQERNWEDQRNNGNNQSFE